MWSFSTTLILAGVLAINTNKQVITAVNKKFGNIYNLGVTKFGIKVL